MSLQIVTIVNIAVFFFFHVSACGEVCPYDEKKWDETGRSERRELVQNPPLSGMDRHCFLMFAERLSGMNKNRGETGDIIAVAFEDLCVSDEGCEPGLLLETISLLNSRQAGHISERLTDIWERVCGLYGTVIERMLKKGMYTEADTLFRALNKLNVLNEDDLLKWLRIKGVITDYTGAAKLCARLSLKGENTGVLSRNRFASMLRDAERNVKAQALDVFTKQYTINGGRDSCIIFDWLVSVYYRFGFNKKEIETVKRSCAEKNSKGIRLLNIAARLFRSGDYSLSVYAARNADDLLYNRETRERCAMILYRSYAKLGKNDSALVWYQNLNLKQKDNASEAVVFFQKVGVLNEADSIIRSMPVSMQSDTLRMRQYIFSDSLNKAGDYSKLCIKENRWKEYENESLLWLARIALYTGKLASFNSAVKKTRISSDWHAAQEMLSYRCRLDNYNREPDSFKYFGLLALALYRGRPEEVEGKIDLSLLREESRYMFAADMASALIESGRYEKALKVLSFFPNDCKKPEVLFYRGKAVYMRGDYSAAGKFFKRLILMDYQDIYSKKAGVYLMKIEKLESM